MFRLARTLLCGVVALASMGLSIPAAVADPSGTEYVALGDSFSAGSGISPNAGGACGRSFVNYPNLVADRLGAAVFRDATCGAAATRDLAQSQSRGVAPQYDALTADTTLVTVGIGGNDVNLVGLAASCINILPEPYGQSCAARNTAGGVDTIGNRIAAFAPTLGTVIDTIKSRSPRATVVMVGYPTGIRPGGCPVRQPMWAGDATYLQSKIDQLNTALAAAAAAHGAVFVDLATSSREHDACAGRNAWLVGLVPRSLDALAPLHPNAAGHANAATQVVAALGR